MCEYDCADVIMCVEVLMCVAILCMESTVCNYVYFVWV